MKSQRMSWVLLKNGVNIGKGLDRKVLANQANASLDSHLRKPNIVSLSPLWHRL